MPLIGGELYEFNQKHPRQNGGRFGRKAKQFGGQLTSANQTFTQRVGINNPTIQRQIKEHPYAALGTEAVIAAVGLRFGAKAGLRWVNRSRVIFGNADFGYAKVKAAKPLDISDLLSDASSAQGRALGDLIESFKSNPFQGVKDVINLQRGVPRGTITTDELGKPVYVPSNAFGRMIARTPETAFKEGGEAWKLSQPYSLDALQKLVRRSGKETIETIEEAIRGNPYESMFIVESDTGNIVSGVHGISTMVNFWFPDGYVINGKKLILTHNHPGLVASNEQAMGFSMGDLMVLNQVIKRGGASNNSVIRAVYQDGTVQELYITNPKKFHEFSTKVLPKGMMARQAMHPEKMTSLEKLLEDQASLMSWAAKNEKFGFGLRTITEKAGEPKVLIQPKARRKTSWKSSEVHAPALTKELDDLLERLFPAPISKAANDDSLRHKKRVQAGISIGTSSLGLAALGTKGASAALPRAAGHLRKLNKAPKAIATPEAAKTTAQRLDRLSTTLVTGGAGLGGFGGFNFAAIQRQEGKKR